MRGYRYNVGQDSTRKQLKKAQIRNKTTGDTSAIY